MSVLYLCINLILCLCFSQISKDSVRASPIQLGEETFENDLQYEVTAEQDEETEEKIQARIRMFRDQQTNFEGYSVIGDIAIQNGLDGRKAIADDAYKWPKGEVPFKFDQKIDNKTLLIIESAIEEWNNLTCINLRPATESDSNFIFFHSNLAGCWSFVGDRHNVGTGQAISIGSGCEFKQTVLHEIGHSLGLYHEQARSDRDQTLKVLWDNISPGLMTQFVKANDHNFSIGYDVMSVMQYSDWAFSRDMFKLNSVATHDPKLQNLLGKARDLSFKDRKVVNLLYKCSDTCVNKNELNCLNEGYVGPGKEENDYKCACNCPPTHRGELCEERISSDYYEAMNITFCGGLINETDQIIEQPTNSTPCTWSIRAPENQYIEVEFENFLMRNRFQSKFGNKSAVNNRCVFESLELRTENHYDGKHYCEDDIKAGDKFESKENIMILIVHTYTRFETVSKGFKARIRFLDQKIENQSKNDILKTTQNSISTNGQINSTISTGVINSTCCSDSKSTINLTPADVS